MKPINWHRVKYLITNAFTYSEWRYQIYYRFGGLFQRAWRGYSNKDTWSFDAHLAMVTAGGLRELAKHNYGCPASFVTGRGVTKGAKAWEKWLIDKAEWFELYAKDFYDDSFWKNYSSLTLAERDKINIRSEKNRKKFKEVVLPDFYKHYECLWN